MQRFKVGDQIQAVEFQRMDGSIKAVGPSHCPPNYRRSDDGLFVDLSRNTLAGFPVREQQ